MASMHEVLGLFPRTPAPYTGCSSATQLVGHLASIQSPIPYKLSTITYAFNPSTHLGGRGWRIGSLRSAYIILKHIELEVSLAYLRLYLKEKKEGMRGERRKEKKKEKEAWKG